MISLPNAGHCRQGYEITNFEERRMNRNRWIPLVVVAMFLALDSSAVSAQSGPISLTVDATLTPEKIVRTRESIPVKPGPFTLYYPKWIPGEHGPDGPVSNVANLKFDADGTEIPWTRDLTDVWTLHVDVPAGKTKLHAAFD